MGKSEAPETRLSEVTKLAAQDIKELGKAVEQTNTEFEEFKEWAKYLTLMDFIKIKWTFLEAGVDINQEYWWEREGAEDD